MDFNEPIIKALPLPEVTSKYVPWLKNKIKEKIKNLGLENMVDRFQFQEGGLYIIATVQYSRPFISIYFTTFENAELTGGGLSKDELNIPNYPIDEDTTQNAFIYLAQKPDGEFNPNAGLYRSEVVERYVSQSVHLAHYKYGGQFTGEMKQQVQLMLGLNMGIEYQSNINVTHGIYTSEDNHKFLIEISSAGIRARQLIYSTVTLGDLTFEICDGTVGTLTVLNNPDTGSNETTYALYSMIPNIISGYSFAFSDDGSEAQTVVFIKESSPVDHVRSYRFKLKLEEIGGELTAKFTLEAQAPVISDRLDICKPEYHVTQRNELIGGDTKRYYAEYATHKEDYVSPFNGINLNPSFFIDDTELVCPLYVYYNLNAPVIVDYFYKKTKKNPVVESVNDDEEDEADINTINDFFSGSIDYISVDGSNKVIPRGWVKKFGKMTITNNNTVLNSTDALSGVTSVAKNHIENYLNHTVVHGIKINGTIFRQYDDNNGDLITVHQFTQEADDDYPVTQKHQALKDSTNTDVTGNYTFNLASTLSLPITRINDIRTNLNTYMNSNYRNIQNLKRNYKLNKTFSNMNDDIVRFNEFLPVELTQFPYLNTLSLIKDSAFPAQFNTRELDFPPAAIELNDDIIDYWNFFKTNASTLDSELSNIQSKTSTLLSKFDFTFGNDILNLYTNFEYLEENKGIAGGIDFNILTESDLSSFNIAVTAINTKIDALNLKIQDINDLLDDINEYFSNPLSLFNEYQTKIGQYSILIDNFNKTYMKFKGGIHGVGSSSTSRLTANDGTSTVNLNAIIIGRPPVGDFTNRNQTYYMLREFSSMFYNTTNEITQIKKTKLSFQPQKLFRDGFSLFRIHTEIPKNNQIDRFNESLPNMKIRLGSCLTNKFGVYRVISDFGGPSTPVDSDFELMTSAYNTVSYTLPPDINNGDKVWTITPRNNSGITETTTCYYFSINPFQRTINTTTAFENIIPNKVIGDTFPFTNSNLFYDYFTGIVWKEKSVSENTQVAKIELYSKQNVSEQDSIFNSYEFRKIDVANYICGHPVVKVDQSDKIYEYPRNKVWNFLNDKDLVSFAYIQDSFTFNYVKSKDYEYYLDNFSSMDKLTNITDYNIIEGTGDEENVVLVNFLGMPFL